MPENREDEEKKLLALRVEFWTKRLDHTLAHTDASNRHIYLVDGAVIALVYFAMQAFGVDRDGVLSRRVVGITGIPTLLLAVLNCLHVLLLCSQGTWYSKIDGRLRALLIQDPVRNERQWYRRTHPIYAAIHIVITGFLLLMAVAMFGYAWGYFAIITVQNQSPR